VHIDTTTPTASDNIASGWQNKSQTVTISDADTGSGPASLVCTLDGVNQNLPATGGSFTVAADGKHTIAYYVVDGAGNKSATVSKPLWIDATAPTTSATTSPSGWTSGAVQVALSATDTGGSTLAKTYYKVGPSGTTQTYSAPFSVSDATQISYWSTDGAGNTETPQTLTPQIDTTAPAVSDDIAAGWQTTAQTVTIGATDTGGSGVAQLVCTLDGTDQNLPAAGGSFKVGTDGQHTISYYATDAVGNKSTPVTKTLSIDTQAPVTTPGGLQPDDQSGWLNTTPQAVTLTATDGLSGMTGGSAATYCRIDSTGAYGLYTGPLSITTAGSHKVDFYSVDAAGNHEATQSGFVNIDTQAPVTSATTDPSGWSNAPVQVTLAATDKGGSTLDATYYKVGLTGTTQTYTKPFSVSDATQVSYWSTDVAGNKEIPQTLTPQIDTQAPSASDDIAAGWQTTAQTVTISATDTGGSGLAQLVCTLDGTDQNLPAAGGSFKVGTDGQHTISYSTTDAAGNKGATVTKTLSIDTQAPVTSAATNPSGWTNAPVTVTLTANDATAGIATSGVDKTYYQVGSGPTKTYTTPFSATDATQISYWSTDVAGNKEIPQTLTPQIDTQAPVTSATTDPSGWSNAPVQVTLAATDKGGSTLDATYYKVGLTGTTQTYTKPFSVSDATPVSYWSTDVAGNKEIPQTLTPQIDIQAPVTSATTDPSGWSNAPVQVTLAATDKGGSTLDATYYKVGLTGTTPDLHEALQRLRRDSGQLLVD
jgi:hypothetical protein